MGLYKRAVFDFLSTAVLFNILCMKKVQQFLNQDYTVNYKIQLVNELT